MKSNNKNKKTLLLLCLLFMSTAASAQTQLGTDIVGEAAGDGSGYGVSLSADGHRMAVGALRNDGNGEDSGHVRVYQWSNSEWIQLGADIDGEMVGDQSGRSVSLSSDGNYLAVGATRNSDNGYQSGQVRVYRWSGSSWVQLGNDIDGEMAEDGSGYWVSLSSDGNRVAIGAPYNDGNGDRSGQARVYQWTGSEWTQLGADIDGEAADDQSGLSVSLSSDGDHLAVGAPRNGDVVQIQKNQQRPRQAVQNQDNAGHVRVFHWSGTAWVQVGADIDGEAAGDRLGTSVSLSSDGTYLAAGATNNEATGEAAGHVRVYHWSGSSWVQMGADIDGEAAEDRSGYTVSLSSDGKRLAIGALGNDGNGDGSGHARVYEWSGSAWEQLGIDLDGESAGDSFSRVSMSSDGNRLVVGASNNDANGESSGHVRVFDLSMFNVFSINPGLNDAWYNPLTSGQGFFITVFPDLGYVSLAWFTYDTDLPPIGATSNLGDPGHRWITAVGPYYENKAILDIEMTSGGLFDTSAEITRTDPPGSDGTITVIFDDCNSGTVEYDIPSINQTGVVPIQRVAGDNIVLCQILGEEL